MTQRTRKQSPGIDIDDQPAESRSAFGKSRVIPSEEISRWYTAALNSHRSLCDEISFALHSSLDNSSIKISEISTRVKSLDSLIEKIKRKGYSDYGKVSDIVGARIVCLFRQDLFKIKNIIEKEFNVESFDDKLYSDPDSFGYMSLHFQCKLRQDYTGPRYDTLKQISFELQVRTICMHAWSAVQHALEYKGEWDVPESLKKDINALSAIFYVADTQFASVYGAKINNDTYSSTTLGLAAIAEALNLDTLVSYARSKFPDRPHADPSDFSSLVHELISSGYKTIKEIDTEINRTTEALALDEKISDIFYQDVGAIRISIGIASEQYRKLVYDDGDPFTEAVLKLIKKAD